MIDFEWSREKLRALPLPELDVRVDDLFWELELPCPDGAASDDSLPLYATRRDGRWVVLDGAERLVQAKKRGAETVRVAVIREYLLGAIAT
ncbi:MAG TPA: hypothetical protein VI408_01120 [Gaiellaceae bacterium]